MTGVANKRRLVLAAGALAWAGPLPAVPAPASPLRVLTSHLPPLVVEGGGKRPGALHEVLLELCRRAGMEPTLEFMPWKRAIVLAEMGPMTAVFPLTRVPEREARYRWLAQLYEENYVLLAPRGRRFDVRRPEAMKGMRIATIRGSAQAGILSEMGYTKLVEARTVDEVHRFLVQGVADAAFGELGIVRNSLRTRGEQAMFDVSEPVRRTAAWLAASVDFPEDEAVRLRHAMEQMVADGTHVKILQRYDLA